MKEYLKSYDMFFPNRFFNAVLYFLMPLVTWGIVIIESILFAGNNIIIPAISAIVVLAGGECIFDFYMFGGFAIKDSARNEYLKTSSRYLYIIKKALVADMVRRFLSCLVIAGLICAVLKIPSGITFFTITSGYFFIVVSICIVRFFENLYVYSLVICIVQVIYVLFYIAVINNGLISIMCAAMPVAGIILAAAHIYFLLSMTKEGYYD